MNLRGVVVNLALSSSRAKPSV